MSIDRLQEKIRKIKCPLVVDFSVRQEHIPPHVLENTGDFASAYAFFCKSLLEGLHTTIPAVRFNFNTFAILGSSGLSALKTVLDCAKELGYYVFLDGVESLSAQGAENAADAFFGDQSGWYFDAIILSAYIGSDALRPYISRLKNSGKDLFVVARTSNKTAPELQDLMTGSRLAHMAVVDNLHRFAETLIGKCGYSQIAVVAGASSVDSVRSLRSKFKNVFLLLDGCDYPNANAKNCSHAFDALGHGAVACATLSVTAAWMESDKGADFVTPAVEAADRLRKNLTRYITIL